MGRLVVALCLASMVLVAPAHAEPFSVTSFDGTRIEANFFPAEGLAGDVRAPTVLYGPGYSSGGEDDPSSRSSDILGSVGVGPLRRAGYNVVTWDPRGFGQSGGTVQIDSPEHEARDVQAIIDAIAGFPQVLLDGPGDPRVGMTGISYGGGIQLNTAQREPRIDAIAPTIAWHSLLTSLFKDGALKAGWGLALCGAGESRGLAEGIFAPGGPQTGGHDPVITRTCVNGIATGSIPPPDDLAWFAARGPGRLVERIRVPTLLLQGTVDTLFSLREAMDNHAILQRNGVPLKMIWYCGGHGACFTGTGTPGHIERRVIAWLDRHLRGRSVDTGPAFEWVADDGTWRSAAGFPLPVTRELRGTAAGTVPLEPATNSGAALAASPAPPGTGALDVVLEPTPGEVDVLGEPRLRLTYSGTASPASTWLYAQVVDAERGRVAGNIVTPIPITLDGREHTIERPLEPVALRAPAGKRYRVQLVPSTTLYYPQKAAGTVSVRAAEATIPIVDPSRAAASRSELRGRRTAPACAGSTLRGFRAVRIRGGRKLRFRVLRHRPRAFRVDILRPGGRRVARVRRRPGSFSFGRRLREGRYVVRVIMPLSRGRRDVRQATGRFDGGRWRVGRVRFAGSC